MELIGVKVNHSVFGVGMIMEHVGNYIVVDFSAKTSKFVFPDAFEKFLVAEDINIQKAIIGIIEENREITVKKRQNEEIARKVAEEQRRATNVTISSKSKIEKRLDDMFSPDYHVEKMARQPIFTYKQVEDHFGIRISGFGRGINPTDKTVVLISSIGKSGGKFVYHDKWTVDGDYIYSGEGKTGDQSMTKGNLAIRDASINGKEIHLFVKFSPKEYYYQGIFELTDYTYEDEKDETGNVRKEYKFRLKKVLEK